MPWQKSLEIYCTFLIIFSASGHFVPRPPTGVTPLDSAPPSQYLCILFYNHAPQYSEWIDIIMMLTLTQVQNTSPGLWHYAASPNTQLAPKTPDRPGLSLWPHKGINHASLERGKPSWFKQAPWHRHTTKTALKSNQVSSYPERNADQRTMKVTMVLTVSKSR